MMRYARFGATGLGVRFVSSVFTRPDSFSTGRGSSYSAASIRFRRRPPALSAPRAKTGLRNCPV
jgi:hypothetical protein